MLLQAILLGLLGAFTILDYQLGTLYAFRPIVTCPIVGLILGDLQAGLAIGASLELLFMGSISIGAYVPPDEKVGSILACAFAITMGQGTEAAVALAMPIAVVSLAIGNLINAACPLLVDMTDKFAKNGNVAGIYAIHWAIGGIGVIKDFLLITIAFYVGVDAVTAAINFIPTFVLDGMGVAANILPAMGFAMLGRLVITKAVLPFFFLGFLLTSYLGMPVLGVAIIAVIIGIEKFDLLNLGSQSPALALEGDDDDDF